MRKKNLNFQKKLSLHKKLIMPMTHSSQFLVVGGEKDTVFQCAPERSVENTLCVVYNPSLNTACEVSTAVSGLGNVSMCNPTEMTKTLCQGTIHPGGRG